MASTYELLRRRSKPGDGFSEAMAMIWELLRRKQKLVPGSVEVVATI